MNAVDINKEKDSSRSSNDDDDADDLNDVLSNMSINSNSNSSRHCLYCLKAVKGSMRCSKCRTALYCNRECQVKHWPMHKNICRDSNDAEDSDEKLKMKADNHSKQGNSIYVYILNVSH